MTFKSCYNFSKSSWKQPRSEQIPPGISKVGSWREWWWFSIQMMNCNFYSYHATKMKTQTTSVCIVHTNIAPSWVEGTLSDTGQNVSHHQSDIIWTTILYLHSYLAKAKWYKKLSELSSLYLMTNYKIGNHGVWSESKERETTTATTYLVHFEDHINPNCKMGCVLFLSSILTHEWLFTVA